MSTINDTDAFLVNRGDQTYKVNTENLMATIQDDDLMLVNRSDRTYKVTGADAKASLNPAEAPEIGSVNLTEDTPGPGGNRFTSQDFTTTVTMTNDGVPTATKSIRGELTATITDSLVTSEIIDSTRRTPGAWSIISVIPAPYDQNAKPKFLASSTSERFLYFDMSTTYPGNSTNGAFWFTKDGGLTWTMLPPVKDAGGNVLNVSNFYGLSSSKTTWLIYGRYASVYYCPDIDADLTAGNWTKSNGPFPNNSEEITSGVVGIDGTPSAGVWVLTHIKRGVYISTDDGRNFVDPTTKPYGLTYLRQVSVNHQTGRFVLTSNGGPTDVQKINYSDDGDTWINYSVPNADSDIETRLNAGWSGENLSCTNNVWTFWSNPSMSVYQAPAQSFDDGESINKTNQNDLYKLSVKGLAYNDDVTVSLGDARDPIYSNDGVTWTRAPFPTITTSTGLPEKVSNIAMDENGNILAIHTKKFTAAEISAAGGPNIEGIPVFANGFYMGSGTDLEFETDKDLSGFNVGDLVTQSDGNATGKVKSVDVASRTMQLRSSTGVWVANANRYAVGPDLGTTTTTLYCELDSDLNVIDLSLSPTSFTTFTGNTPKIKFPSVLSNGAEPDTVLLDGTSIKTTVVADNLSFPAVDFNSNTVAPSTTRSSHYFDASDATDVTLFNNIKTSLDDFENSRDAFRSDLETRLLADGYTTAEVTTLRL